MKSVRETFTNPQVLRFLEHEFDFNNQTKTTLDDWNARFEELIAGLPEPCFTGLSSGYDSGMLTHAMERHGKNCKAYCFPNNENREIIDRRVASLKNAEIGEATPDKRIAEEKFLRENIENEKYVVRYNGQYGNQTILADSAAIAAGICCRQAAAEGYKYYISTQGTDEIIADYALFPAQSTYKGVWPTDLKEWDNFKHGANWSYMMKEERVPAAYGIETVFPFLDIVLVQEWLNLTPEMKNAHYKHPIYAYLKKYNIPFDENVKRGFML